MLTKQVNGKRVTLSTAEEEKLREEWRVIEEGKAAFKAANDWRINRVKEYKDSFSLADQIDIIQKQLQWMVDKGEVTLAPETGTWLSTIAQIKTNNPKPE